MMPAERSPLVYKVGRALLHPELVIPKLRRAMRNVGIRAAHPNHIDFYREVMACDASKNPDWATGSTNRQHWNQVGKLQFDYLVGHGVKPNHKILEIGCGNLRAGWHLISYLNPGSYVGLDISPAILLAAQRTIVDYELQEKTPYLLLLGDMNLEFLPAFYFDVVHAHSVFTHLSIDVIDRCLSNVGRVMKRDAFFDFTFFCSDGRASRAYNISHEDFYYPATEILALVRRHGFEAKLMDDWDYFQPKIRATKLS